jgi:hypothetical protein
MAAWRFLSLIIGGLLVLATLNSAIRTLVLPRSASDLITRIIFLNMRRLFNLRLRFAQSYAERDWVMSFYAPLSVLILLPAWLILILVGYAAMFWGVGLPTWEEAFIKSGSSLFTLGFSIPQGPASIVLVFSEAMVGMILVALLIAYLPTMYSAFTRREAAVTLLEVRAGSPPSPIEMILRFHRIGQLDRLRYLWESWETWFAELDESHASLAALVFFRSPRPERSWVTSAGAVLDGAALVLSVVDVPSEPQAALCLRAGYITLRNIADFFFISYPADPHFPQDPISISREEFDAMCAYMAREGVPVKKDLDQAWQSFGGWRVNYDRVLIALCTLTMAPFAVWSSDRAPAFTIPPLLVRIQRKRDSD